MVALVLTPEQAEFVKTHDVEVLVDAQGNTIGHVLPATSSDERNRFTREEIDEALREEAADPRVIPHAEVMAKLRRLADPQ